MRALWELQRATVTEMIERMHDHAVNVPSYNSVLTLLGILERKGYVTHRTNGRRAYVFEPRIDRGVARRSALANLVARFFDGSPTLLVLDLLGSDALNETESAGLRKLLEAERPKPAKSTHRRRQ
jgi:predicted transcriptional regulator